MKLLLTILLTLCAVCALHARTWTNQSGKTVEADFVSVNGDQVTIRMADGREFALSLKTLSQPDREWIQGQKGTASATGWKQGAAAGEGLEIEISPGVAMRFRWCPPTGPKGFPMGSPVAELGRDAEEILHAVVLTEGFWMAETECTQAQWQGVMNRTLRDQAALAKDAAKMNEGPTHPIADVSPTESMEFCGKVSASLQSKGMELALPTEAQWEYACRAGTETTFAFGPQLMAADAVFGQQEPNGTHPVASKRANAWGIFDMHGNVSEWCQDLSADYPKGLTLNPTGASTHRILHVFRGGGWYSEAKVCRSAHRGSQGKDRRSQFIGFRPVLKRAPVELPLGGILAAFPAGTGAGMRMRAEIAPNVWMSFAWCPPTGPAGFTMGAPKEKDFIGKPEDNKATERTVILTQGFWMAVTECTQAQWFAIMGSTQADLVAKAGEPATNLGPDYPVYFVDHNEAKDFCARASSALTSKKAGLTLPTEAQWEYACRAGSLTQFTFGEDLDRERAYFGEKSGPAPAGQGAANGFGLRDMHGNVWEWCADLLPENEDRSKLAGKTFTNPTGSSTGELRVMRGGSWKQNKEFCSSYNVGAATPTLRDADRGFRPVVMAR